MFDGACQHHLRFVSTPCLSIHENIDSGRQSSSYYFRNQFAVDLGKVISPAISSRRWNMDE
jgi:hypothetical protein